MYTDVTEAPTNTFNVSFDANGAAIAAIPDQVIAASPVDGRTEDLTISFDLQTHTKPFEIIDQTINGSPEGKLVNIKSRAMGLLWQLILMVFNNYQVE